MTEYRPWKGDTLESTVPNARETKDVSEGMDAIRRVREKMGGVLKKDQALKVSMYVPETIKREEGDVWEEDGKTWEMKKGTKRSVSKLQDAKRPWWCPVCGKSMNTRLDDKMWLKKSKCYDCVVQEETQMRLDGTWQKYQISLMRANAISWAKETISELESFRDELSNPQNHFMDGRFEEWEMDHGPIKEEVSSDVDVLKGHLAELEKLQSETE